MTRRVAIPVLIVAFLALVPALARAEYSAWSFFGGLNLIYNSDGEGVTTVPGMQEDGNPGGLSSAPSPIVPFLGAEFRYRLPVRFPILVAPSVSLYPVQYLWANERPLPAEIENRTSYVPSLLLDIPILYTVEKDRFLFSFGGGPAILARWGFLEFGVPSDAINPGESLDAGEQVDAINEYFWKSGRWFYPTVQAGVRYKLETGWGGGFTLRTGIPIFNLWSKPEVPFVDSLMIMASIVITPPVRNRAAGAAAESVTTDGSTPEAQQASPAN